jgi:bestrophin-3
MTVTYTAEVATAGFWNLYKLLFKWRGSVWKLLWRDVLVWFVLYVTISMIYRVALPDPQRR